MSESFQTLASIPSVLRVAAGADQFGEHRGLGISFFSFKLSTQKNNDLFIN